MSKDFSSKPLFEESFLADNYGLDGIEDVLPFYSIFLEQTEGAFAALSALAQGRQLEDLRALSHKLKSTAWVVGAWRVGEQLQVIETASEHSQESIIMSVLPELERTLVETRSLIQNKVVLVG